MKKNKIKPTDIESYKKPNTEIICERRNFTNEELLEKGQQLSEKLEQADQKTNSMKAYQSQMKSEIEIIEKTASELAAQVRQKYCMQEYECELTLNYKEKKRQYFSKIDGTLIRETELFPEDFQLKLNIENDMKEAAEEDLKEEINPTSSKKSRAKKIEKNDADVFNS